MISKTYRIDGGILKEKGGWKSTGRLQEKQNKTRTYKKGVCLFKKETRESKMRWGKEFKFRS